MILEDDQFEEVNQRDELTETQRGNVKQWIKSEVRKAGGRIDLQDLMKARRADNTIAAFWKRVTDPMWIEIAQECQNEWAAAKAAKAAKAAAKLNEKG